jgi:hypothetical protein
MLGSRRQSSSAVRLSWDEMQRAAAGATSTHVDEIVRSPRVATSSSQFNRTPELAKLS